MRRVTPSLDTVFCEAIAIDDVDARAARIQQLCGANHELLQRVSALVAAHFRAGNFLDQPANANASLLTLATNELHTSIMPRVGSTIGPYKLRELLGEGGMGLVFVAEQEKPVRRKVALKIIKPGMDSREVISRFETERQALALMDHTNIAKVLDAGTTDNGNPFFVMELVKGTPITEHCNKHKLGTRERLKLFLQVCQAVQHAHQKGIIHRDLKPSNILVAMNDTVPTVKVIDFGVAKAIGQQLTDKTVYTGFNQLVGTPLYMSPEQAGLSNMDIDTRSDIYSLGVLLYEVLTGLTPFDDLMFKRAGFDEMRRMIREDEPQRPSIRISTINSDDLSTIAAQRQIEPRKLSQQLRGELDWIVMRSIEKDRNRRYNSASALADDIQRVLSDAPVVAGPPSKAYRLEKFIKRNRLAIIAWAASLLALLCGVVGILAYAWRASQHNRELTVALNRATTSERRLLLKTYADDIQLAAVLRDNGQSHLARDLLIKDARMVGAFDPRGFEWFFLVAASQRELQRLKANGRGWEEIQFLADGQRIVSIGNDHLLKRFDSASGQILNTTHLKLACTDLTTARFSQDGRRLMCMSVDLGVEQRQREFSLWNTETDECEARHKVEDKSTHEVVCLAPSCAKVAYFSGRELKSSDVGLVRIWDAETQQDEPIPGLAEQTGVDRLCFSPDNQRLAIASHTQTDVLNIEIRNVATGELISRSIDINGHATGLCFAPNGQSMAVMVSQSSTSFVVAFEVTSGQLKFRYDDVPENLARPTYSPDGRWLAVAAGNGGSKSPIRILDAKNGTLLFEAFSPDFGVGNLSFSANAQILAAGGADGVIYVREPQSLPDSIQLPGTSGQEAWAATFSHDSQTLAVGYDDEAHGDAETLKLWKVADGQERVNLRGHRAMVTEVRRLTNNSLASSSFDGSVCIWDLPSQQLTKCVMKHVSPIRSMATSNDGRWIATASDDLNIRVYDTVEDQEKWLFRGPLSRTHRLAISPGGNLLASSEDGGSIHIWDLISGRELAGFQDQAPVFGLSFSPDGQQLVFGNRLGEVKCYDLSHPGRTPALLGHKVAHEGDVMSITFSPDAKTLASAGKDGTVRLWQWSTGEELLVLGGLSSEVSSVAFSPDGQKLAATVLNGTVHIWSGPRIAKEH